MIKDHFQPRLIKIKLIFSARILNTYKTKILWQENKHLQ